MLDEKSNTPTVSRTKSTNAHVFATLKIASVFFVSYLLASLTFYPSVLLNGRIWAEEARDFLIPQVATSQPLNAIFYLHKAHLDLFPNIATFLSLTLPIKLAPYIFSWVALIPIACFSICFGEYLSRLAFSRLGVEAFKK